MAAPKKKATRCAPVGGNQGGAIFFAGFDCFSSPTITPDHTTSLFFSSFYFRRRKSIDRSILPPRNSHRKSNFPICGDRRRPDGRGLQSVVWGIGGGVSCPIGRRGPDPHRRCRLTASCPPIPSPKDPDQERQAQMMEMLQKMAAERPDGAE